MVGLVNLVVIILLYPEESPTGIAPEIYQCGALLNCVVLAIILSARNSYDNKKALVFQCDKHIMI